MKNYIEYKVKFSPIIWRQEISKDKVDKLFITIDGQIFTSRLIYCSTRTYYASGVFYKFKLPVLETIVYDVVLNMLFYGIKYNERQIH